MLRSYYIFLNLEEKLCYVFFDLFALLKIYTFLLEQILYFDHPDQNIRKYVIIE